MVPIPVVYEYVDPRGESGVDFTRDNYRIGPVFVAPEGNFGLAMAGFFRHGLVDILPFSAAVVEYAELFPTGFRLVCGPNICGEVVFRPCRADGAKHSGRR